MIKTIIISILLIASLSYANSTLNVTKSTRIQPRYGEIYVTDNVTATTISVQNTWYQVVIFTNTGASFLTTPSAANDDITISKTGDYAIRASISFAGGAGKTYEIEVQKNNGATELTNLKAIRTIGSGGDTGSASISGLASLTANDTVELWIRCTDVTTANVTIQDVNLSLQLIGN